MVPVVPQFWRCTFLFTIFLLLMGGVGWKLLELQVNRHQDLSDRARRQQTMVTTIPAVRGGIFDCQGRPLAVSIGSWDLFADPSWMTDKLGATISLAKILQVPRDELRQHFESGHNGRCLAQDLDEDQAKAIVDLGLDGIYLKNVYRRRYPIGTIAPHVLGFVLDGGAGGAGVELQYDHLLAGRPGRQELKADGQRQPCMPIGSILEPAIPGAQVQLTIDARIQLEVQRALAAAVERYDPTSACAVVIRPTSGAVVAMASWPTFDLHRFTEADPESFRNQILAFVYESGSTMKPLVAGAAIAEGVARWDEKIFCENGRFTYRHGRRARTIHDHSFKHGGHQLLDVVTGVAKSDNILMAKLGLRLGPERLYEWIDRFGFGRPTGIQLPGENCGIRLPQARWNHIDSCMSIPMGHELAVTPLQMAMAHAAVANHGLWLPPRLVERILVLDPSSQQPQSVPLPPLAPARRIFSQSVARHIQEAMVAVMEEGTGKGARLKGYSSAGKTGTTEKLIVVDGKRVYSDKNHIGSFIGWAPARADRPAELLVLVVIDDAKKNGHYGSQTAAPVVQHLLQFGLEYLGIPADDAPAAVELARRAP